MPGERVVERVKFTAFVYIRPEFVVTATLVYADVPSPLPV